VVQADDAHTQLHLVRPWRRRRLDLSHGDLPIGEKLERSVDSLWGHWAKDPDGLIAAQ
jgi:hypothetical protein